LEIKKDFHIFSITIFKGMFSRDYRDVVKGRLRFMVGCGRVNPEELY